MAYLERFDIRVTFAKHPYMPTEVRCSVGVEFRTLRPLCEREGGVHVDRSHRFATYLSRAMSVISYQFVSRTRKERTGQGTRVPNHRVLNLHIVHRSQALLATDGASPSPLVSREPEGPDALSSSITSSALAAFPPHTTTPCSSIAHAPALCHLFPITMPEPSGSSAPAEATPFLWIDSATLFPSQPFSFQPWIWVVGLRTDQRVEVPRPQVA